MKTSRTKYNFLENGDLDLNGIIYNSTQEGASQLYNDIHKICNAMDLTLKIMVSNETIKNNEDYMEHLNFVNAHLTDLGNVHQVFLVSINVRERKHFKENL